MDAYLHDFCIQVTLDDFLNILEHFHQVAPSYIVWSVNELLLYITLLVSVCLYPKNVKPAEPIGPTFFEETHISPGGLLNEIATKKLDVS